MELILYSYDQKISILNGVWEVVYSRQMKELLTVLMMSICMASFGQSKSDSVEIDNAKLEVQTPRILNDSLVSKINKMLIFHYYAFQIIQTLNSDGSIRSRKDFIEAVRQYNNYYKNKHE